MKSFNQFFFYYCEITKHDESVNDPILERGIIVLLDSIDIISILSINSSPDPLELSKFVKINRKSDNQEIWGRVNAQN